MLLSRKRDTRFQSILEGYLHDLASERFKLTSDYRGNTCLRTPVNFKYRYQYPGSEATPSKYFYAVLLGSVYITPSCSKLVCRNTVCLGFSLAYSSYFVDSSEICDKIWNDMMMTYSMCNVGITQDELYNYIESSLPRYDDPSIRIENTSYYKGVPKWVDTSTFIPILLWNTYGYRIKVFYGYGKTSKWLNLEDMPRDIKYDIVMKSNISLDCMLHLPDSCLKAY